MISQSEEKLAVITYKLIQASERRNALEREKLKCNPSCATTSTATTPAQLVTSAVRDRTLLTMDEPAYDSVSSVMDSSSTLASSVVESSQEGEKDPLTSSSPVSSSSSSSSPPTTRTPSDHGKDWVQTEIKTAADTLGSGVETKESGFVQQALQHYQSREHAIANEVLASRLIITNIAADATTDDLYLAFRSFGPAILDITMLSERQPIKRTQTAIIDFTSRSVAVKAAIASKFLTVFGLRLYADLAVKDDDTRLLQG